jgi:hypothetical protein
MASAGPARSNQPKRTRMVIMIDVVDMGQVSIL